ncbi:MAG: methylated-DNA--[protein]-cysteine S-methyltransferase [Acidimicrobiia bacterium]
MTAPYGWWHQDSPIGPLVVYVSDVGVCCIELDTARGDRSERSERRELASERAPAGRVSRPAASERVRQELDEYFAGDRTRFSVPVDLGAVTAPFRRRVLETLRRDVRYGETVAYGELAAMAGRPGAARAVGSAMATCPVPILVPCHRVLAAGGVIGGYGGRIHQKRALLAIEGVEVG